MGTIPKVNLKLDSRASQARKSCLDTPVILRKILEQFSNRELLEISRVNKQWNYEARSVLRDRGTLTAKIGSNQRVCQALVDFAGHLRDMRVVPFSGIHILLSRCHSGVCHSIFNGSLDPAYKVILERRPWKRFEVQFRVNWEECGDCPAIAFVQEILNKFCGVMEILSLIFDWREVDSLLDFFLNRRFPRLKALKLETEYTDPDFIKFVKVMVSSAPNLKEFQVAGNIYLHGFNENVLEGSSAVLVPRSNLNLLYELPCDSLLSALRPETIEIHRPDLMALHNDQQLLTRLVPTVLQAAVTTIKTLRMDLLFVVPLMCYGICLENVTGLEIRVDYNFVEFQGFESTTLKILKGFDFARVFPKLKQVEIACDAVLTLPPEEISSFVEQADGMLQGHLAVGPGSSKPLVLRGAICSSTVAFLAEIFADVKTLSVEKGEFSFDTPFTSLWEHFKNLKELTATDNTHPSRIKNLDSVVCGIFPEEVAELREKDDVYLKAVNIVPVMASIACMKELKSFTFRYTPQICTPLVKDSTFIFSKVAGLIGFARGPALAVTFQTASRQCAEALGHMKPYAAFTSVDTKFVT